MKKVLFFALFLLFWGTVSVSSQVTIGDNTAPDKFSLLDIVTTNIQKGIHMPRLTTAQRDGLIAATAADRTDAKGLAVYNTTTDCYNVWNGKQWLALCDVTNNTPQITTQPRAFNWKEVTGAGNLSGIGGDAATISVVATGSDLTYQWYEIPKVSGAAPIAFSGATSATYTPILTALGMRRYYCVVSNAYGSVKSEVAKVAVGCGALAVDGTWRAFMCYNLGATVTSIAGQLADANNLYYDGILGHVPATAQEGYSGVFGDLYQWGRKTDGHEKRTSANSVTTDQPAPGTYTPFDAPWAAGGSEQIRSDSVGYYGRFIPNSANTAGSPYDWNRNPTGRNNFLWRNLRNTNNDPCTQASGASWRIPSQSEWGDIYRGGTSSGGSGAALANTWTWRAPGATTNGNYGTAGGYEIKPDGVTTTLFLPASGLRGYADGLHDRPGAVGAYWTTTSLNESCYELHFRGDFIVPALLQLRALGLSVRCIAEI